MLKSTVIVSVYKDAVALNIIFMALARQNVSNFEVIVSEDCESTEISEYLKTQNIISNPVHLQQEDRGFRKNRALNRAIVASQTEHLIFIDGDCIPHPGFVNAHQRYREEGICSTGRRVELGPIISTKLRNGHYTIEKLSNPLLYLINMPSLRNDGINDYELGLPLGFLQNFIALRPIRLVGCNLACHKNDLYKINGFNEDYEFPGIGEDSDIDWRLKSVGVEIRNVKFSAIQYHLYHERGYGISDANLEILNRTQEQGSYYCEHGIDHHTG